MQFRKIQEFVYKSVKPSAHWQPPNELCQSHCSTAVSLQMLWYIGRSKVRDKHRSQLILSGPPGYQFSCQGDWNCCCEGEKVCLLSTKRLNHT